MPRKKRDPTEGFPATVRAALEHYHDVQWLGVHSPLATPYFLGERSPAHRLGDQPEARGRALQGLLSEAADSYWGGPPPPSPGA